MNSIVRYFYSSILDLVYPPVCISCNNPLSDHENSVCPECWQSMRTITREHPLYRETYSRLLAEGNVKDLISCFVFEQEGPLQKIAHALKYKEFRSCGIELGKHIGEHILNWNITTDIIIPVPLHRIRERERGYNQSEIIAIGIASIIGRPVESNLIYRIRNTRTQTKLNIEQRLANVKGAFSTRDKTKSRIVCKDCLLVDDIITTGATTSACAEELLKGGARSVIAASAALAI